MDAFRLKRSVKFVASVFIGCKQFFPHRRTVGVINNLKRPAFSTALQSIDLELYRGSVAADLFAELGILDLGIIIDGHEATLASPSAPARPASTKKLPRPGLRPLLDIRRR